MIRWQPASSQKEAAQKTDKRFDEINVHLAKVDARLEAVDDHLKKINTRIKGLSQDMAASLQQVVECQLRTEQQIDTRFTRMAICLEAMDARFDRIEATMATREMMVPA